MAPTRVSTAVVPPTTSRSHLFRGRCCSRCQRDRASNRIMCVAPPRVGWVVVVVLTLLRSSRAMTRKSIAHCSVSHDRVSVLRTPRARMRSRAARTRSQKSTRDQRAIRRAKVRREEGILDLSRLTTDNVCTRSVMEGCYVLRRNSVQRAR